MENGKSAPSTPSQATHCVSVSGAWILDLTLSSSARPSRTWWSSGHAKEHYSNLARTLAMTVLTGTSAPLSDSSLTNWLHSLPGVVVEVKEEEAQQCNADIEIDVSHHTSHQPIALDGNATPSPSFLLREPLVQHRRIRRHRQKSGLTATFLQA